jgi:hypothetical protein
MKIVKGMKVRRSRDLHEGRGGLEGHEGRLERAVDLTAAEGGLGD